MKNTNTIYFVILHILLMVYSVGGIFSKEASAYPFFSTMYVLYYGLSLLVLVIYTLAWKQILKHMSLVTAYANKAVTMLWGIIMGRIFYDEPITLMKIIGVIVIVIGVFLVISEDFAAQKGENDQMLSNIGEK